MESDGSARDMKRFTNRPFQGRKPAGGVMACFSISRTKTMIPVLGAVRLGKLHLGEAPYCTAPARPGKGSGRRMQKTVHSIAASRRREKKPGKG